MIKVNYLSLLMTVRPCYGMGYGPRESRGMFTVEKNNIPSDTLVRDKIVTIGIEVRKEE